MLRPIPFAIPEIGDDEISEVIDTLKSGWITTGPKTAQFEKDFAAYIGVKHALAINSATAGLHLALDAIGIQSGDKVITTINTFTATAEVIRYFNADPIFCDIDPETFNIDASKLEKVISQIDDKTKLKAIIPVHIAGQSCDMDEIQSIAQKYNLKVIEDAAHALPSTYKGKKIGTISDLSVFSFYATKTITTGEGGMIVTNSNEYAKRIKVMRLHGFNKDAWNRYSDNKASWYYEVIAPGYKYNMTDIAASLGIHQLKKSDQFYNRRKEIATQYNLAFKDKDYIQTPFIKNIDDIHSYHLYIIKVSPSRRDSTIEQLKELNIGCSVHFIPLHLQPYWQEKYKLLEQDFPVATDNFSKIISLPIYTKMTDKDVQRVIDSLIDIFEKA